MAAQLDRTALYISGALEIFNVWCSGLQCSSIRQRLMNMVGFPPLLQGIINYVCMAKDGPR